MDTMAYFIFLHLTSSSHKNIQKLDNVFNLFKPFINPSSQIKNSSSYDENK